MKRIFLSAVAAALCALLPCTAWAKQAQTNDDVSGSLVVLHTNDTHGHVDESFGFAAVSALRKEYLAANADVVLLDAGDTFHGTPFATLNRGQDICDVLNATGYDAMVPGVHDFSYGWERLVELQDHLNFPILAANVVNASSGKRVFDANTIIKRGGRNIGVFGLVSPQTTEQLDPELTDGIKITDPFKAAQAQITSLKRKGATTIIALTHLGVGTYTYSSDKLAAQVRGIDIVIDGASHTELVGGKPTDDELELSEHGNVLIAQAGSNLDKVGVIQISAKQTRSALVAQDKFDKKDSFVEDVLARITSEQGRKRAIVVGKTPTLLVGEKEVVRKQETNLGDLTADAMRHATKSQIAIVNGGAIYANIEKGSITESHIVSAYPHGNTVVTVFIDGATLLETLEHAVQTFPKASEGFPQISGFTFTMDADKDAGQRISDVKIGGKALNPKGKYLLAINQSLSEGRNGFTMLETLKVERDYGTLQDIVMAYLKTKPDISSEPAGRITVKGNTASTHVTAQGDTLWSIAQYYLGNPMLWEEIYRLNGENITNENVIVPGMELTIPGAGSSNKTNE